MEVTESFLETFFQFTCMIQQSYDANWNKPEIMTEVKNTQSRYGHMGLCTLAKEYTVAFESLHKNTNWEENDWYEELEEFFNLKNNVQ